MNTKIGGGWGAKSHVCLHLNGKTGKQAVVARQITRACMTRRQRDYEGCAARGARKACGVVLAKVAREASLRIAAPFVHSFFTFKCKQR